MHGQRLIFLLTYMVAYAISVSLAFNLDITQPEVYNGEQEDFFGYKVHQYTSGKDKGIIVTAPLKLNGSGGICKPRQNQTAECFNPKENPFENKTVQVKHLGLSLAVNSISSIFTVCSPSVVHECDENSYLNSVCYKITDQLEQISSFQSGFQKCTKKTVDLVFLFDGSESMTTAEFGKNKDFIVDIMKSFGNSSIKFAAAQFSTITKTVFNFKDYEAGRFGPKLRAEPHMKGLTNTHKALKFVLDKILTNENAGASPDATKVLVLITDGDPSDSNRKLEIIEKYDELNIIRFVIGVKITNLDKVKTIASEPKDKNAFKIDNYAGLTGILDNFQKRIFTTEGSKVSRAGEMTNEMSQSGFSAVAYKDTLILGSVGSNSWRGSLHEVEVEQTEKTIEDPDMKMDSYMGYSVAVGERDNTTLYFTGAPRFEYKGQVVVFKHNGSSWITSKRINGYQIGSYFGAEICSVDINSDDDTDFLLVGAPLFYHADEKKEGRIYIYTLTNEMDLKSEMNVTAPSMGRFGTTISSIADLNGDFLRDLAVGAPLEDENRGAVYIYLGDSRKGIRSTFSQRITGQDFRPMLRFFGQAIDGNIDLGEDGLPDIVVGSHGAAVVLRSRPVFNVKAHLSFQPKEISTEEIDCVVNTDHILPLVTLTVCFEMVEATQSREGIAGYGLNISYMLDVDPTRPTHRGFFSDTDRKARNLITTYELTDKETCVNHSINMKKCVRDTLSSISIKLNFSQVDSERASAVLNVDSERQTGVEVPFKKECRKNDACIAELEVDLDFESSTFLVAEDNSFNVFITLSNEGDDSYNTSLTMHYPPGLSFSRMTPKKDTRPTLHICHDLHGVIDKSLCSVSLPVYRSRSKAYYNASFRIEYDPREYEWNDTISMTVVGNSDNMASNQNNSMTKSLPVKYEIKMATTVSDGSTNYMIFTPEDSEPKELVNIFTIDNLGLKAFPVNFSLLFPTKLAHEFEMTNYQVSVQQNKTECTRIIDIDSKEHIKDQHWKMIMCDSFILDGASTTEVKLYGDVQFRGLKNNAENMIFTEKYRNKGGVVEFRSHLHVSYDDNRYVLNSDRQKNDQGSVNSNDPRKKETAVQIEFLIPASEPLIIGTGVVLGLIFLLILTFCLIKCGCFKRRLPKEDDWDEANGKAQLEPLNPDQEYANADIFAHDVDIPEYANADIFAHDVDIPEYVDVIELPDEKEASEYINIIEEDNSDGNGANGKAQQEPLDPNQGNGEVAPLLDNNQDN
ncbi:integrin alpha-D [Scomber japonicus]|uniref:integrin alpha-D n=1 Tax=Scomber japonicus TaxID=13676 RepID=UPI0023065B5A|nr:integrin alpha-D [Scomber japonicus]